MQKVSTGESLWSLLAATLLLGVIGLLFQQVKMDDRSFLSRSKKMAWQFQPQEAAGGDDQDRRRVRPQRRRAVR